MNYIRGLAKWKDKRMNFAGPYQQDPLPPFILLYHFDGARVLRCEMGRQLPVWSIAKNFYRAGSRANAQRGNWKLLSCFFASSMAETRGTLVFTAGIL